MKIAFKRDTIISWVRTFIFAAVIVLLLKGCVGEFSYVVTPSMGKAMYEGDFYFVNKLAYGPRLIRTPLSFPFIRGKWYSDLIQFPYLRFLGEPGVERNDVLAFNFPMDDLKPVDHRDQFVKRCVGLPGDTIDVRDGFVFVNGTNSGDSAYAVFNYIIKTKEGVNDTVFLEQFRLTVDSRISDEGHYSFYIHDTLAKKIAASGNTQKVERQVEKKGSFDETVFPYDSKLGWNADNFGPLYIPKSGDTLAVDSTNFYFYERMLVYEGRVGELKDGKVFIDGVESSYIVPRLNYYFVLGDSRHESKDSRHWGFLPEDHIAGKASFVFFSYDRRDGKGFRKSRWFKKVN